MDQVIDRPETGLCAKRTLGGLARTGTLLMAAAMASVLAVDLPIPAGRAADSEGEARRYVPASGKWIELGASPRSASSADPDALHADLLHKVAAVDPAATSAREEERRKTHRKPRGVQLASLGRDTARIAKPGGNPRANPGARLAGGRCAGRRPQAG